MLTKSRVSALAMSATAHLAALIVSRAWFIVDSLLQTDSAPDTGSATSSAVVGWLALLALIASSIGLISLPIYKLDDSHFGPRGAIRWALAGVLYGLLWRASSLLTPGEVLRWVLQPVLIGLSYWVVFKLFPSTRNKDE